MNDTFPKTSARNNNNYCSAFVVGANLSSSDAIIITLNSAEARCIWGRSETLKHLHKILTLQTKRAAEYH